MNITNVDKKNPFVIKRIISIYLYCILLLKIVRLIEDSLYRKNKTCKNIITEPGGKRVFVKSRCL